MKRLVSWIMAAAMAFGLAACGTQTETPVQSRPAQSAQSAEALPQSSEPQNSEETVRVAGLKGPTTMGMVKLMKEQESQESAAYTVNMYGAADEIVPLLSKGELDMAAIPANLAAVLYQKTEGKIQVAAVNTLGVLYVVTTGDDVNSVADLKGKTIYSTGKGTTPEHVLNYILTQNGIDPEKDVNIEYKSEATEVLAAAKTAKEEFVAVLPQPYVSAAQAQIEGLKAALDLTQEWTKINHDSQLITGVMVVRTEFAKEHPQAVKKFLKDYEQSIQWVQENTEQAAALVAEYGIVAKAPLAQKALPACNLTYLAGSDMKQALSGYLQVLFDQNPAAVGGSMPDDEFYYGAE